MNKVKETKGITLIALVITIIVLLILAGVTISQIASQDSAPEKAVQAKKENEVGAAKDAAAMLVSEKIQGYYEDKYVKSPATTTAADQLAYIAEKLESGETTGDYIVKVTSAGAITVTKGTGANAEELAKGSVSSDGVITWGESSLELSVNTNGYKSGEWIKDNIKITLTSNVAGAKFQLSLDEGTNWENCNSEINITEDTNATYMFRVLDSADEVVKTSARYIIKRDATGPAITATAVANNDWAAISSIQVNVTSVSDAGIGVDSPMTIYYYCKLKNQSEYELKYQGNDTSYKIDDLEPYNTYSVKVVVRDQLGNEGVFQKNEETYACFVAGTKVKTENGMKNIEDIKVGEKVYTVNLDTNATELKEVTKTLVNKADVTYLLHIGNETIEATPKHEFYIVDKGWVRAYALQEGDYIYGEPSKKIEKIEKKEHYEPINVYNLVIDGNHNYLITNYGVLVHNGSPI